MRRNSHTGFAFLILAAFSCTLPGCGNTDKEIAQLTDRKKLTVEEALNVESQLSQNGSVKAKLFAPRMIRYTADSVRVEFPNNLHTEFYLEKEKLVAAGYPDTVHVVESHIYSKYGKYTEFDNRVYLRDSVVAFNVLKADTLWSDELWWDQNKQEIYTDGPYYLKTHDGQDLRGVGLRAAQNLQWYELKKGKGNMQAPQGSIPY
jgi:hypothetical protein